MHVVLVKLVDFFFYLFKKNLFLYFVVVLSVFSHLANKRVHKGPYYHVFPSYSKHLARNFTSRYGLKIFISVCCFSSGLVLLKHEAHHVACLR